MTSLGDARAELVTAVLAAGISATTVPGGVQSTPYVAVLGDGLDLAHVVRGQAFASFRLACIAGSASAEASVVELDALKLAVLDLVRGLAGWRMGEVRADGIRTYGGGEYLTADVTAGRMIDYP
jgi:hypothetical protein